MYKIVMEQYPKGVVAELWYYVGCMRSLHYRSQPSENLWEALRDLREKYVRSVAKVDMKVKCGEFAQETTIIQVLSDMVVTSCGHGRVQAWKFSEITWIEGMDEVFLRY